MREIRTICVLDVMSMAERTRKLVRTKGTESLRTVD